MKKPFLCRLGVHWDVTLPHESEQWIEEHRVICTNCSRVRILKKAKVPFMCKLGFHDILGSMYVDKSVELPSMQCLKCPYVKVSDKERLRQKLEQESKVCQ